MSNQSTSRSEEYLNMMQSMAGDCAQGFNTVADIVLVMDATGSMTNLFDTVKKLALSLDQRIRDGLLDKNRPLVKLRIKVITFRDVYVDSEWLKESRFFTLPDESAEFHEYVEQLRAIGGGDEPENALEALSMAFKTNFIEKRVHNAARARHIVILLTDASAHKLDDSRRSACAAYPNDMPKNLTEFKAAWEELDPQAKRLALFAPNVYPWTELASSMEMTQATWSKAGVGIPEQEFTSVIKYISESI